MAFTQHNRDNRDTTQVRRRHTGTGAPMSEKMESTKSVSIIACAQSEGRAACVEECGTETERHWNAHRGAAGLPR